MSNPLVTSAKSMALVIALGLSACSLNCPPPGLGRAADPSSDANTRQFYETNAWINNRGAAEFLRARLQAEGLASLTAKHGMQCAPRPSADCPDCLACTTAFPGKAIGAAGIAFTCEDYGWVFVRAEIGPGARVAAMTYWQTPGWKSPK